MSTDLVLHRFPSQQSSDEDTQWIDCVKMWKEFHQMKINALKEDINSLPTFVSELLTQ